MIIENARWLTESGQFEEGAIQIEKGRIIRLYTSTPFIKGEKTIDGRGYLILPGMIDPHVHFREPGQLYKEGIRNGSRAALKGGVTTVLDMPNNRPPVTTRKRLEEKRKLFARKSLVNWGLFFHATKIPIEIDDLAKSVKIFMARSSSLTSINNEATLLRLFGYYPRVSIHAEDESVFSNNAQYGLNHFEHRPREAVLSALQKIEHVLRKLPAENRPRVIICHTNTAEEMDWILRMRNEGFDICAETAPHYLFFTQENYLQKSSLLQVNPPIRTKKDRDRLRAGLAQGIIDFIGTDHAPHTPSEKQSSNPPSGIAGIEWVLPLALRLIDDGIINWKQLHNLTCGNAARCYDIACRDGIKEGNWADLVFVKRLEKATLNTKVFTKAGFNVYGEMGCYWQVERTMVNGIIKYQKGKILNEKPGMAV